MTLDFHQQILAQSIPVSKLVCKYARTQWLKGHILRHYRLYQTFQADHSQASSSASAILRCTHENIPIGVHLRSAKLTDCSEAFSGRSAPVAIRSKRSQLRRAEIRYFSGYQAIACSTYSPFSSRSLSPDLKPCQFPLVR